jgi:hypothetical protein
MKCCRCKNTARYRVDVWVDSAEDTYPAYVDLCGVHKNVLVRFFDNDDRDFSLWGDIYSYDGVEPISDSELDKTVFRNARQSGKSLTMAGLK